MVGCNKAIPNPETLDPIYNDLLKRLDEQKKELEAERQIFNEHEKALKAVVPQTGQIKYASKRYWESVNRMNKISQMIRYLEFKAQTRKRISRAEYSKAFRLEKPWPDPAEFKQYMAQRKVVEIRRSWDLNTRFAELGLSRTPASSKKEKKSSSGGGGGGGH